MRYNSISLSLTYKNGANHTVSYDYIVKDSLKVSRTLMKDLKSSTSTCSLQISRDCTEIESILGTNDDIRCVVKDGDTVVFTGYISSKFTWKVTSNGEKALSITVEDLGSRLLNKQYVSSSADSTLMDNTVSEVIASICTLCGIQQKVGNPTISTNVKRLIEPGTTCKDILDTMLFEVGYAYVFSADGKLALYNIAVENQSSSMTLNGSNLYATDGDCITLSKALRQYGHATVSYDGLKSRSNVLVYQDVSGKDTGHPYCNFTIPSGYAYPSQTEILGKTDAELTSSTSVCDLDEGKDIIGISDVTGTFVSTGNNVTYSITQKGADELNVLIKNRGSIGAVVSRLEARANIIYVDSKNKAIAGQVTDGDSYDYECKYIHDKTSAQNLSNLICQYHKNSNYSYTFLTKESVGIGDIVTVQDNIFSGMNAKVLVTSVEDSSSLNKCVGVSISPFRLDADIEHSSTLTSPSTVPGVNGADGENNVYVGTEDPDKDSYYVWIDPCGEVTELNGKDAQLFTLSCDPLFYDLNSRGYVATAQEVTVTATPSSGVTDASQYTVAWSFDGDHGNATLASDGWQCVVTVPVGENITSMTVKCAVEGLETKTVTLDGKPIEEAKPKYWGRSATEPTADPLMPFIQNDYYLDISANATDGKYNNIPKVRKGNIWVDMSTSDSVYAEAMLACGSDILKDTNPNNSIREATIIYAYISNLMAENAVLDNLFARDIQLFSKENSQGQIRSQGYVEGQTGKGFIIKQDGTSRFVDVTIDGTSTISGDSDIFGTISNTDADGNVVFKTHKGNSDIENISGTAVDGSTRPDAFLWSDFKTHLTTWLDGLEDKRVYAASTSILRGVQVTGAYRVVTVPTSEETFSSSGAGSASNASYTFTAYDNSSSPLAYKVSRLSVKRAFRSSTWYREKSIGALKVYYLANDGTETVLVSYAQDEELELYRSYTDISNLVVPPYSKLMVYTGATADVHNTTNDSYGAYATYVNAHDNFPATGTFLIKSDGSSELIDTFIPGSGYGTSYQCLSLDDFGMKRLLFNASANWVVPKYYGLHYTTTVTSETDIKHSFFTTNTFVVNGHSYDVGSITYNKDRMVISTSEGNIELSATAYQREYLFTFDILAMPLGAYASNLLPTTTTSAIGGSENDKIWNEIYGKNIYYNNLSNLSKREYKENIEDFTDDATEIVNSVDVVSFNYKNDEDRNYQIGFIADDTDWRLSGIKHDRMDISNCLGVLIKAVQELSARIDELERR